MGLPGIVGGLGSGPLDGEPRPHPGLVFVLLGSKSRWNAKKIEKHIFLAFVAYWATLCNMNRSFSGFQIQVLFRVSGYGFENMDSNPYLGVYSALYLKKLNLTDFLFCTVLPDQARYDSGHNPWKKLPWRERRFDFNSNKKMITLDLKKLF